MTPTCIGRCADHHIGGVVPVKRHTRTRGMRPRRNVLASRQGTCYSKAMNDQYKLELPGDSIEIMATNDAEAQVHAREYLRDNLLLPIKNLKLFRYPKDWATRGGTLIEIPFMLPVR